MRSLLFSEGKNVMGGGVRVRGERGRDKANERWSTKEKVP